MRLARWGAAVLAACCLGLVLAPAGWAHGRLDRSFGKGGVVDLGAELVGDRWLGSVAVAPDGGVFVAEDDVLCPRGSCPYRSWLKRYRPDGTLDRRFDPGPRPVATGTAYGAELTTDSVGRPILFWNTARGRQVVIRRLLRAGRVDRSFGRAGTIVLDCGCGVDSVTPLPGGGLLIAADRELDERRSFHGTRWIFFRLRPDGSLDRRFGRGGIVRMRMPGLFGASATPTPRGSAVLTAEACCGPLAALPFVGWLSPRGSFDRRFASTARHSLRGTPGTSGEESLGWEWFKPILRSRGRIDIYGFMNSQIVVVRLRRDGRLDRSFGHRGHGLIPLQAGDAAPDGAGGAFVVGYRGGGFQVRRIGPGGRLDRGFGRLPLRGAYNEEGLAVLAAGRGRALVLARDEEVCRQVCPSDPKLYRVVGGS